MRSAVYGTALTLASILITLSLIELSARAFVPPAVPQLRMYRSAPRVVYELLPGWEGRGPLGEHIRINAAGLRGPAIGAKDAGTIRILALGDSFTFGLGVDERNTFPRALDRALESLLGDRPIEVLNGGVPGYNLFQETQALEVRAPQLAPDLVVLGFVENDLYNLDGSDFVAGPDGGLVARVSFFEARLSLNPFAALSGPWLWLQLHSAAFRLTSFWAIQRSLAVHGDADLAELARRAVHGGDLPTKLLRGDDDEATASRWESAGQELKAAAESAQRIGAPLVIVLFPRPEQLFAPELRGGFSRIARDAQEAGLLVVDPGPRLAEDEDRIGLYLFPADHHPSPRCYERIADITARMLVASGVMRGDLNAVAPRVTPRT